jgi:class 3 adenylate cyclase/DNA-binding beta-propeller fold protein YncE
MAELPSGTVTFLFTDIEGSTRLLQELRDDYSEVLLEHQRLLRSAFEEAGGQEIDTQGDAFFFVFARARAAVAAAEAAQRNLAAHDWPHGAVVRVRMGIHSGEPTIGGDRYVGLGVHRASRICAAAHGGQVLLSNATRELIEDDLPSDLGLRDLGEQKLKDIDRPERLYQLVISGLPTDFPPLRTPVEPAFSGREGELVAAAEAVVAEQPAGRARLTHARIGQAAAVLVVVVGVVVALLALRNGGTKDAEAQVSPKSVAVIDPAQNAVTGSIALDGSPSFLAGDGRNVWITNAADKTLLRVDTESRKVVKTIGLGTAPKGLATGARSVWITSDGFGSAPLIEVVPATNDVRDAPRPSCCSALWFITGDDERLWIASNVSADLLRFEPSGRRFDPIICCEVVVDALTLGEGALWVVERDDQQVVRMDSDSGDVEATIPIGAPPLQPLTFRRSEVRTAMAAGEGGVWVVDAVEGLVWQIDPVQNLVKRTISVGAGAKAVAIGFGSVWVANGVTGTVLRIDPSSGRVIKRIKVAARLAGIATAGGAVWTGVP